MQKSFSLSSASSQYQSKYNCIICLERVKVAMFCVRCKNMICHAHLKKMNNKCPYCRLEPFQYCTDKFVEELVKLDRKREEDYLISTKVFRCLVQGCQFQGKYHKMDLHRRKEHRKQNLKEILFEEDREEGKKRRAMQLLMGRLQERFQKNSKSYQIALILHNKSRKRAQIKKLFQMVEHIEHCKHKECQRVHVEEEMCFIGNDKKELSDCPKASQYLTFY